MIPKMHLRLEWKVKGATKVHLVIWEEEKTPTFILKKKKSSINYLEKESFY